MRRDHRRLPADAHHDLRRHQAPKAVLQGRLISPGIVRHQSTDRQAAPAHRESSAASHAQHIAILAPHHRTHRAHHFERQGHGVTQSTQHLLRRGHRQPRRSDRGQPDARPLHRRSRSRLVHQAHLIQPVLLPTRIQRRQIQHGCGRSHQIHPIPHPLQLHGLRSQVLSAQAIHCSHHAAQLSGRPFRRHRQTHRGCRT